MSVPLSQEDAFREWYSKQPGAFDYYADEEMAKAAWAAGCYWMAHKARAEGTR